MDERLKGITYYRDLDVIEINGVRWSVDALLLLAPEPGEARTVRLTRASDPENAVLHVDVINEP